MFCKFLYEDSTLWKNEVYHVIAKGKRNKTVYLGLDVYFQAFVTSIIATLGPNLELKLT